MKKRIKDLVIIENKKLNHDTFLLLLKDDEDLSAIMPGQFVEVLVEDSSTTFLRRPISVHDVDKKQGILSLFIKIVGDGTAKLAELKEGQTVNLIYPLGNHFDFEGKEKVLLIGGGCGVAPLLYLSRQLKEKGTDVDVLLGAATAEDILQEIEYQKYAKLYITTEDGSKGEKGFLIHHSIMHQDTSYDKVYSCGPEAMMKAVAKWAKKRGIDAEVSLENTMACGIGACLCCVTETQEGNKCVCTEGPVFNINELTWQI